MGKTNYTNGSATVDDLFYWMKERHKIYLAKKVGEPWPWTEDPILQEWKFTNVFRQLDKGTVALIDMLAGATNYELILANTVWYRLFNRYEHATDIGFCNSFEELQSRMRAVRDSGKKVFTGAHMTWAPAKVCKVEAYLGSCKLFFDGHGRDYCMNITDEGFVQELKYAFDQLLAMKVPGIGPFIAYEIVSDLRWTLLTKAHDINTWANIGPGCKRGLERLGMEVHLDSLRHLLSITPDLGRPLELREIEHSLCEFDKYQRVKTGAGRPRGRYQHE
jgi:hypothetical protein